MEEKMKNIINKPVTDKQKEFARLIVEHSFGENSMMFYKSNVPQMPDLG